MGFAMRTKRGDNGPPVTIGIDLGTFSCRVGLWRDGDVLIVPNERGLLATSSCIAFLNTSSPVIGDLAAEQAVVNMDNTIFAPQRMLGAQFDSPWALWQRRIGFPAIVEAEDGSAVFKVRDRGKHRLVRPEEAVSLLLEDLRHQVEQYLGVAVAGAVVTVPAQYGRHQRQALIEACQLARVKVLAVIKAPSAAAIAFSLTNPYPGSRHVLVLDFGASYCNFCLLSMEGLKIIERAIGSEFMDLDACLVRFCVTDILQRFNVNLNDKPNELLRLRFACEAAKRKLSQWGNAKIDVDNLFCGVDYSVGITRSFFEEFCRRDLEAMLDLFDMCLEECGVDRNDVEVVLVGGSSRVPKIRRLVKDFFRGKAPREVLRPDHAGVLGASVYAASLQEATGSISGISLNSKDMNCSVDVDADAETDDGVPHDEARQSQKKSDDDSSTRSATLQSKGDTSKALDDATNLCFAGLELIEVIPWPAAGTSKQKHCLKEAKWHDDPEDSNEVPCDEAFMTVVQSGPRTKPVSMIREDDLKLYF